MTRLNNAQDLFHVDFFNIILQEKILLVLKKKRWQPQLTKYEDLNFVVNFFYVDEVKSI